jgi:hypothetical protein
MVDSLIKIKWLRIVIVAVVCGLGLLCSPVQAMQAAQKDEDKESDAERSDLKKDAKAWNLELPTLGGKQFWTDHRWWNGWRVQFNGTFNHWRLIDPKSVRRAWGGQQAMLDELESIIASATPSPESTEVVLLVHGLMRTASSMKSIELELLRVDEQSNTLDPANPVHRTAIPFSYASTREPISAHAAALRELVENLPGKPRISFVGHSLGNIVFRHAIGDWQRSGDPKQVLTRLNRAVMLGPPNQGSAFAKSLSRLGLFKIITGNSGMQLGPAWEDFGHALAIPPCPFAIVAGDISKSPIQNPLLNGISDGVVTLEEATLDGMAEIAQVPVVHSLLMSDPAVVKAAVSFLSGTGLNAALERK